MNPRVVDDVRLEWCRGNVVILDFQWKKPDEDDSTVELEIEEIGTLEHTVVN